MGIISWRKQMEQRNWKYKINGGWPTLIMASVMLAIFGGISIGLKNQ